MQQILIIGATSAIAQRVACTYAKQGAALFLVGRNALQLDIVKADVIAQGANRVECYAWDAHALDKQSMLLDKAQQFLGQIDVALIAYGSLPHQQQCEQDVALTLRELQTNAISVIALLSELANRLIAQKSGTIAVISSVAGDRGRGSNYVYGSAKAAVSTFLQGLRARLAKHNIHVLTVKPGFVDTPMTAHLKKSALFASPTKVANDIILAIQKKRDTLYTPNFWQPIMLIIKCLPERIAKRMNF
ncbi:MAG: SDR family oxidoreductase [Legionellaceae bacterium]|nr:SDR family oxidoreductase [Legionellaceae bacterium]